MDQWLNPSSAVPLRKIHQVFERAKGAAGVNDFGSFGNSLDKPLGLSRYDKTRRCVGEHYVAVGAELAFEDASQQSRVGLRIPASQLLK